MKIKLRFVLPIVFGIILVLSLVNMASNRRIYNEAQNLLANGMVLEAKEVFESVADYKDSTDMIKECDYQRAEEKLAEGEFSSAVILFTKISGHRDADARCKEAYYLWLDECKHLFREGNLVQGTLLCQKLKDRASGKQEGMVFKASWLLLKVEMGFQY